MSLSDVFQDWRANAGDPRSQVLMAAFRVVSAARGNPERRPAPPAAVLGALYRLVFTWILGIEIPWKTRIGPRLHIFHGVGLVIHDASVIGSDVVVRQGVTIGHRFPGSGSPVIGDRVEIGPNAVILGPVTVGPDARIGANSVVLQDIPAGAVVLGSPARVVRMRSGFDADVALPRPEPLRPGVTPEA